MAIASLLNVPSSKEELNFWAFCHMAHHRDVNAEIFRLFNINVEEFVLDPFDPRDAGGWAYQHQNMHDAVNSALGLQGFDLTEINWQDQTQLAGFIQSNMVEHLNWNAVLEVG